MTWVLCMGTVLLACIQGSVCFEDDPTYMQCSEWPDRGPCNGTLYRYYYNFKRGLCRLFVYGGCQGNDNNFRSRNECMRTCATVITARVCRLKPVSGPSHSRVIRYYFQQKTQSCRPFVFSGCGGNRNNFVSSDECRMQCFGKEEHEKGR